MSSPTVNFTQRGSVALTNGATSQAFTFPVAFQNVPFSVLLTVTKSAGGSTNITATAYGISQAGFSVGLSAAIPDTFYTLSWEATAVQPTPTAQDGCECSTGINGGCGCGGNGQVPNACQPPSINSYLFTGVQGQPGPLSVFCGPYNAAGIYYCNSAVSDIVSYAGGLWRTINTAKNSTDSWGTPMVGSLDWAYVGTVGSAFYGNSYVVVPTNNSGNTVITPITPNETDSVTITGAASTRIFAISDTGQVNGNKLDLLFTLPATAGIIIQIRDNTVGGTLINSYTTDGVTLSGKISVVNTGSAWIYAGAQFPL
jgi:hypothetical protein